MLVVTDGLVVSASLSLGHRIARCPMRTMHTMLLVLAAGLVIDLLVLVGWLMVVGWMVLGGGLMIGWSGPARPVSWPWITGSPW